MEYSIQVKNKFSLALDEDEDPLEVLKIREQEREQKKKEKLSEKAKQPEQKSAATKPPKARVIKDAQQPTELQKNQGESWKIFTQRVIMADLVDLVPHSRSPIPLFLDFPAFARDFATFLMSKNPVLSGFQISHSSSGSLEIDFLFVVCIFTRTRFHAVATLRISFSMVLARTKGLWSTFAQVLWPWENLRLDFWEI